MIPSLRPVAFVPDSAGLRRTDFNHLPPSQGWHAESLFARADRSGDGVISPAERAFGLPVVSDLERLRAGVEAYRRAGSVKPTATG